MPTSSARDAVFRVRRLSRTVPHAFDIRPDGPANSRLAGELGLRGLRKLCLSGELRADGDEDWRLDARLGATVTQDCVVTLAPVVTRIEEEVIRRFLSDWPPPEESGDEVEMPEDESIDPLGTGIDLWTVMVEALTLALPVYPRVEGAVLDANAAGMTAAGASGIEDEEKVRPFAGLSGLKRKLENGSD